MRLGTCNIRNPYGAEPFRTVARKLPVHRLAFVVAQIKWDKDGRYQTRITFFLWKGRWKSSKSIKIFVSQRIK